MCIKFGLNLGVKNELNIKLGKEGKTNFYELQQQNTETLVVKKGLYYPRLFPIERREEKEEKFIFPVGLAIIYTRHKIQFKPLTFDLTTEGPHEDNIPTIQSNLCIMAI